MKTNTTNTIEVLVALFLALVSIWIGTSLGCLGGLVLLWTLSHAALALVSLVVSFGFIMMTILLVNKLNAASL